MTEKPLAFLSLVKALEAALGHKMKYNLLEPFPCTTLIDGQPAITSIQKAAGIIARHLGLHDLIFVVSVTTQDPSTAGHIELRYGAPEVFVEISRNICDYKDAVLATLCHEISHKFLHQNGIRHGSTQIEQEFLTDVAAVYLGMGKIMLNGCECQSSCTKTEGSSTTTTTRTLRTGYISRECFAFVYRLVCEMRRVPPQRYMSGLSDPARKALSACEREYGPWFIPKYHTPEGVEELGGTLRQSMMPAQASLADYDHTLRWIVHKTDALRAILRDSHRPLHRAAQTVEGLRRLSDNPHLRYLACLEARESVAELTSASSRKIGECWPDLHVMEEVAAELQPSEASESEVIECPADGTKLRVPSGRSRLLVTCSACKYKFMVSTARARPVQEPSPGRRSTSLSARGIATRVAITVVALFLWFWTQSLIGQQAVPYEGLGDGFHTLLAPLNDSLHGNPGVADGLLIVSSAFIDLVGIFLLGAWILGRSVRPFLGLVLVLGLRQVFQALVALPPPAGMLWHYPGFPSLLVTYGVANDFFFSGHTAVAVLGAVELGRLRRPWLRMAGVSLAIFEVVVVLALRAHYTMDVFTGAVAALYVAQVAERLAPALDRIMTR